MQSRRIGRKIPRAVALAAISAGSISLNYTLAHAATLGDIFVIAMENHNWTQPAAQSSPQPIFNNVNAPFITSLVTPGNPNAAQVSYETAYYHPGFQEHPSEPNYVWAEAGTNFNQYAAVPPATPTNTTQGLITGKIVNNDNDPGASSGNVFPASAAAQHLTGQLNAAGIPWKNYQEDYQYSTSPTVSAAGTGGVHNGNTVVANPYNGTLQYDYAVKHNPMAFFTDTATQNVRQMSDLAGDLASNNVGRYNWITPNQFNDMHSSLSGGYHPLDDANGLHDLPAVTGDNANIRQGDDYLKQVIPIIMASSAYQNNGAIIIWNDETEQSGSGDDNMHTSMEIVISPLAKGNAYASSIVTSHSSDIKSMEELFGLPFIDNPIPSTEVFAGGGYAQVAHREDLNDLFVAGAVPEPASLSLLGIGAAAFLGRRRRTQVVAR